MASAELGANGMLEASDFKSDTSETSLRYMARRSKFDRLILIMLMTVFKVFFYIVAFSCCTQSRRCCVPGVGSGMTKKIMALALASIM